MGGLRIGGGGVICGWGVSGSPRPGFGLAHLEVWVGVRGQCGLVLRHARRQVHGAATGRRGRGLGGPPAPNARGRGRQHQRPRRQPQPTQNGPRRLPNLWESGL